ncbi:PhzF family phenazine biosynthesis protein, partial [Thioclava sp. BHET1]
PVTITRRDGRIHGTFTAPILPQRHAADLPVELIAQALDLSPAAIGFAAHRPGVWQGGPRFLYIPLADRAALAAARAIEPHWSRMLGLAGADSAYLYTPGKGVDFQARMYSPGAGIPEDPATGSATAILAGALHAAGVLSPGTQSFQLLQGAEMGRP